MKHPHLCKFPLRKLIVCSENNPRCLFEGVRAICKQFVKHFTRFSARRQLFLVKESREWPSLHGVSGCEGVDWDGDVANERAPIFLLLSLRLPVQIDAHRLHFGQIAEKKE